ncbi:hypothetical protein TBLA_0D05040 [Henningerozyma blattae CBS 6284]|uniref:Uncharacterized protein n=1 Tax=Henningerozyma blattae (strain ATCC 34711 / CBS 6284 / DSM 70876 / NBRC 10599 / NRRL Y-10934 / UCD 77-7) TaxID=1071380 RepID=I2H3P6_HENB6|nr:hypothetical protein TBLA_0D05040 [Tetrapisispora blattae CBS 6284]CCH60998.1 hypothetical protein TBLA_0D05040 [Tetrapisispora blattae CBS 6284]
MDPVSKTTQSLVGLSIRDIDDKSSPKLEDEELILTSNPSSKNLLHKIHSPLNNNSKEVKDEFEFFDNNQSDNPKQQHSYTNLDDLNKTGALLSDEINLNPDGDIPGEINSVLFEKIEGEEEDYKLNNFQKQGIKDDRDEKIANAKKLEIEKLKFLEEQKLKNKDLLSSSTSLLEITKSNSNSATNLVTTTDPIDDSGYASPQRSNNQSLRSNLDSKNEAVRNSFGELIVNQSHKPHLARGDSYQSITNENESETDDQRHGRSSFRSSSTDYLRSLSRSLSRDPKKKSVSGGSNPIANTFKNISSHSITNSIDDITFDNNNDTSYPDEESSRYTNNYTISQNDLQTAASSTNLTLNNQPLVEEEEEIGGVLKDNDEKKMRKK